jgi:quercetin dioxygenase-like cupin family protein
MKDQMEKWDGTPYPEMIRKLPEIDISLEGVRGWLLQSEKHQTVFFDLEPVGEVPPHSHCAQWGLVVEGRMKLTIGGEMKIYEKGDWYYIPAGVVHSATFLTRVQAIDVFDDAERYKPKTV